MKRIFYILIFFIESLSAQKVDFSLYMFNPCEKNPFVDSIYYLTDNSNNIYSSYGIDNVSNEFFADTIVALPSPGVYYLHIMDNGFQYLNDSLQITIPDTNRFSIMVHGFVVQERLKTNYLGGFFNCDGLLNGYHEDYYENKSIRLKGNFREGLPDDRVIYYHKNGSLKRLSVYKKRKIITHDYDSLSNLIYSAKFKRTTGYIIAYNVKVYYPNGRIKKVEKKEDKSPIIRVEVYYPDGREKMVQDKNRFIEYYQNGGYKINCSRKRINRVEYLFIGRCYDYRVKRFEYNEKGNITLQAVYDYWGDDHDYQDYSIANSDWILSLIEYKNGDKVNEINNCKTEECYKNTTANK